MKLTATGQVVCALVLFIAKGGTGPGRVVVGDIHYKAEASHDGRRQSPRIGSRVPSWELHSPAGLLKREVEVAVEMGTNTRATKSGSGTGVHAVHARLQGEGEQSKDGRDSSRTGSRGDRKQASQPRREGNRERGRKTVTVREPKGPRAPISVDNGARAIIGCSSAAGLRRCYIQTAHRWDGWRLERSNAVLAPFAGGLVVR
jgi:hypothetical protein